MSYKKKIKKVRKKIDSAIVNIKATFNNTIISVTDLDGDVIHRASAGGLGHTGQKKGTPFGATSVGMAVGKAMAALGILRVSVNLKGPGAGREAAVRALQACGIGVSVLRDVTPIPHNGCRAPKKRRV